MVKIGIENGISKRGLRIAMPCFETPVMKPKATVINSVQQDSSPEQICLHFEIHRSGNRIVCGQMYARTSTASLMADQYFMIILLTTVTR